DLRQIELAERRGLEDLEALRVRGHETVLDAVVHHLDEVAAACWPGVHQAAFRRERLQGRLDGGVRLRRASHHQAISVLQPPDSAAGARVAEMDAALGQLLGPALRIAEVGVAAVDDDIALLHARRERGDQLLGDLPRRYHRPADPRWRKPGY